MGDYLNNTYDLYEDGIKQENRIQNKFERIAEQTSALHNATNKVERVTQTEVTDDVYTVDQIDFIQRELNDILKKVRLLLDLKQNDKYV